jgi:hypothetical protein
MFVNCHSNSISALTDTQILFVLIECQGMQGRVRL